MYIVLLYNSTRTPTSRIIGPRHNTLEEAEAYVKSQAYAAQSFDHFTIFKKECSYSLKPAEAIKDKEKR